MISRKWHAYTTFEDADNYENAVIPNKAKMVLSHFENTDGTMK
jgi:hypothetical protein